MCNCGGKGREEGRVVVCCAKGAIWAVPVPCSPSISLHSDQIGDCRVRDSRQQIKAVPPPPVPPPPICSSLSPLLPQLLSIFGHLFLTLLDILKFFKGSNERRKLMPIGNIAGGNARAFPFRSLSLIGRDKRQSIPRLGINSTTSIHWIIRRSPIPPPPN